MFDNPKFEKIGKDIYVYKNFVLKKELDFIKDQFSDKSWLKHPRLSTDMDGLDFIYYRLKVLIDMSDIEESKNWKFEKVSCINRMLKGESQDEHSDNAEFKNIIEMSKKYIDGPYKEVLNNIYNVVVYLNTFKGGQLYFTEQDILYTPKIGDLIIYSSNDHCAHEVLEVKSDVRYFYCNAIYESIKIPLV